MTKQEIYDALVSKYDKVSPIVDWEERGGSGLLGVNAYLVNIYDEEFGHKQTTLHVDAEGTVDEVASFGKDSILREEPVLTATQELQQEYSRLRNALVIAKEDVELGIITQADYDILLEAIKTLKASLEK